MPIINEVEAQNEANPLKRSKTGFELELQVVNQEGAIVNEGYALVKEIAPQYPDHTIEKECGMNMVELGCYPDINTYNPALHLIETTEILLKEAKKKGLRIYPFATYPGSFTSEFTPEENGKYSIQKKIFGKEKFELATKVTGFHHHYTLPKGVFDAKTKTLKHFFDGKIKRSLMNSYNFEIAIDPIITCLTQSSPYFEGKNIAKDTRMLLYRGGKRLRYKGLYDRYQSLGGLPPYKQTLTDLFSSLKRRHSKWRTLIKNADPTASFQTLYPFYLDISWNPVKINKHGTLEQRGMSSNYLSLLIAVSALIKFSLKRIHREFIEVIPSDIGIKEPFKFEHGILYIPPHTYVRDMLQKASAYQGLENDDLHNYVKAFLKFIKPSIPEYYASLIKLIEDRVHNRRTVSDDIIAHVKKKKYLNEKGQLSEENARKLALYYAKAFEKDLKQARILVENVMNAHQDTTDS